MSAGWRKLLNRNSVALCAILLCAGALAALATSTTSIQSSSPTSLLGKSVTLTATVTPSAATGKVAFYSGVDIIGVAALSNGTATLSTTLLPAGTPKLHAYYAGDSTHDGSASTSIIQTVTASPQNGFQPAVNYPAGTSPAMTAFGDFNGDGKVDLAVANFDSGNVSVLLGNGNGTFAAAVNYPTGGGSDSVVTADVNRDGRLDLIVVQISHG